MSNDLCLGCNMRWQRLHQHFQYNRKCQVKHYRLFFQSSSSQEPVTHQDNSDSPFFNVSPSSPASNVSSLGICSELSNTNGSPLQPRNIAGTLPTESTCEIASQENQHQPSPADSSSADSSVNGDCSNSKYSFATSDDRIVVDFLNPRAIPEPTIEESSLYDFIPGISSDASSSTSTRDDNQYPEDYFVSFKPSSFPPDHDSRHGVEEIQHDQNSEETYDNTHLFGRDSRSDISMKMFQDNHELLAQGYTSSDWSKQTEHLVRLLHILGEGNIPLGTFDKVIQWADNASRDNIFQHNVKFPRRETLLKQLSKFVGTQGMLPNQNKVTLTMANVDVMVTTIDAHSCVMSLLNDRDLMRACNLNFFDDEHSNNIFSSPKISALELEEAFNLESVDGSLPPSHLDDYEFVDIFSGTEVRKVYNYQVKMNGKEMIVPVIVFIDKTHIDKHGRACQEPVCITLGIFKKEVREQPYAWRSIGYIPNQAMHVTAKKPSGKSIDYHTVLRHIFVESGLSSLMEKPVYWEFPAGIDKSNVPRKGLLNFYFGFLTGDTEGNDKAAAHYTCRSDKVKHLCRKCNTPFQHISDPFFTFELLERSQICPESTCNDFSFHFMPNGTAFEVLDYGYPGKYCHIAHWCANDYMHIKRLGMNGYCIAAFRNLEKANTSPDDTKNSPNAVNTNRKRKSSEISNHEEDDDPVQDATSIHDQTDKSVNASDCDDDVDEDDLDIPIMQLIPNLDAPSSVKGSSKSTKPSKKNVKHHLFSPNVKYIAEKAMLIWGVLLSNQSARDFPRTYFPQGPLSTDKLNAHEYQGLLLLYLLLLCCTLGSVWFEDRPAEAAKKDYNCAGWLGNDVVDAWANLFEGLILQDGFIRKEKTTMRELRLYKRYNPILLDEYKRTVDRTTGLGMSFVKFHIGLHDADDILRFGPMSGFDTGVGETNHKEFSKKTASRTQKRAKTLDFQSATRLHENTTIHLSLSRLKTKGPTPARVDNPCNVEVHSTGSVFSSTHGGFVNAKSLDTQSWHDTRLQGEVTKFLRNNLMKFLQVDSLPTPGYIKKGGVIYRADPSRNATRNYVSGWNDWAIVNWGATNVIAQHHYNRKRTGSTTSKGTKRNPSRQSKEEVSLQKKADLGDRYLDRNGRKAPAHILCFVQIDSSALPQNIKIMGRNIDRGGVYAVCHAVTQHPPDAMANGNSLLLKRVTKDMRHDGYHLNSSNNLLMYLIHVDDIVAPCACVPDIWPQQKRKKRDLDPHCKDVFAHRIEFVLVEKPDTWPDLFVKRMESILEEALSHGSNGSGDSDSSNSSD